MELTGNYTKQTRNILDSGARKMLAILAPGPGRAGAGAMMPAGASCRKGTLIA